MAEAARLRRWLRDGPRLQLVRKLPRVSRGLTAAATGLMLLNALLPTAFTIASGTLIGRVPAAARDGLGSGAGRSLLAALAVVGALYVVQQATAPLLNLVSGMLGRRVDLHLGIRAMTALQSPATVVHLEDPSVQDDIAKLQGSITGYTPGGAAQGLLLQWSMRLTGIGALVVLASYKWWLALLFCAAALGQRSFWRRRYDEITTAIFNRGEIHRRSAYLRDLLATPPAAKEVRAFGLGSWLHGRFHDEWQLAMAPVWSQMRGKPWQPVASGAAATALTVVAMALIARDAVSGAISLGAAVVWAQSLWQTWSLGGVGDMDHVVAEGVAAVPVLVRVERELATAASSDRGRDASDMPQDAIRFEGVAFRYPGRDADVYSELDLEIRAGSSLAIVGDNGAGKTTLVKLLAGLYPPTAGRITVDGIDLSDLDQAQWQRRIAAIFQDFQRYELGVRENVGFGAPELLHDERALDRVAVKAGVADIIGGLEAGWDTPLSRQRTGGTDLSGGEWQRLALARALLAVEGGARVLVLDEPTANLDVRSEAALYDRFLDLTAGLTTILISHRFSTVRRADRIVVITDGVVTEDGTHDELMALGGRYAEMFALQAARFAADPSDPDDLEWEPA
jgi:ATP-binding cassette, subfamily B, bacterial